MVTRRNDSLWQWVVGAGEEKIAQFADEMLANPRFRESLGAAVKRAAQTKGQVDRNIELLLGALNLPSKRDLSKLATKVEAIQGSLVNLSIKLDRLAAAQAAQAAAAPTRAPRSKKTTRRPKTAPSSQR
jgi:hypothetical protein